MDGRYGQGSVGSQGGAPELARLERPGGARGWRLAAAALAILLVGVGVAGRLGMEPSAQLDASPSPSATTVAAPSPSADVPSASPSAEPAPTARTTDRPTPKPAPEALPELARHLDGIPTSIRGEKVYRVPSALRRAGDEPILVGGWYVPPDCSRLGRCPFGSFADSPLHGSFERDAVAVQGEADGDGGPRVFRGTLTQACARAHRATDCVVRLEVSEIAWRGDFHTRAAPIEVQPLLQALSFAFPGMHPEPFRDLARCAVPWPPQTYRSLTGGPRMTLIFPTYEDRIAVEKQIVRSWPDPRPGLEGQCLDHFMANAEGGNWVSAENVMLWLSDDALRALAEAALVDAAALSSAPRQPELPRPLTTWAAVRALQAWDPELDLLPAHDVVVSGPRIVSTRGVTPPLEAYALNDPFVRLLAVFGTRFEREAYQEAVDASGMWVLGAVPYQTRPLGAELYEWGGHEPRWLGHANVLLQVGGPHRFDGALLEALRSVAAEAP